MLAGCVRIRNVLHNGTETTDSVDVLCARYNVRSCSVRYSTAPGCLLSSPATSIRVSTTPSHVRIPTPTSGLPIHATRAGLLLPATDGQSKVTGPTIFFHTKTGNAGTIGSPGYG